MTMMKHLSSEEELLRKQRLVAQLDAADDGRHFDVDDDGVLCRGCDMSVVADSEAPYVLTWAELYAWLFAFTPWPPVAPPGTVVMDEPMWVDVYSLLFAQNPHAYAAEHWHAVAGLEPYPPLFAQNPHAYAAEHWHAVAGLEPSPAVPFAQAEDGIVVHGRGRNKGSNPTLTRNALRRLFHMSAVDAATHLGICVTALKITCRRLGIQRWPYQRGR